MFRANGLRTTSSSRMATSLICDGRTFARREPLPTQRQWGQK
jgi:hypothetical protein